MAYFHETKLFTERYSYKISTKPSTIILFICGAKIFRNNFSKYFSALIFQIIAQRLLHKNVTVLPGWARRAYSVVRMLTPSRLGMQGREVCYKKEPKKTDDCTSEAKAESLGMSRVIRESVQ